MEEEEEGGALGARLKPVFVPRSERETIREREEAEAAAAAAAALSVEKLAQRKEETKQLVVEMIAQEAEILKNTTAALAAADIDTEEEGEEEAQFEAWKVRELARLRRDKEERAAASAASTSASIPSRRPLAVTRTRASGTLCRSTTTAAPSSSPGRTTPRAPPPWGMCTLA